MKKFTLIPVFVLSLFLCSGVVSAQSSSNMAAAAKTQAQASAERTGRNLPSHPVRDISGGVHLQNGENVTHSTKAIEPNRKVKPAVKQEKKGSK